METLSDFVPYKNLANAIVKNAALEYRNALKKLISDPWNEEAWYRKRQNERFFRSDWYKLLTSIKPEYLINRIQKEVGYID